MANLDEFKQFVRTIPGIRNEVLDGHYTWQQLYEIYTIYGEKDKVFERYVNETKEKDQSLDLSKLMFILKNIDLDAVSRSLDGVQKLLNIVVKMNDKETDENSFYKDRRL
ncbi:spore coat protein YlbD [Beduini massiliensis]|uniref:spore coat protein YlbD n=1 Tax=Beduini massiliensis TaxID=1585974 RepID=UPI00059A8461|nr:spore coat protein YlbD [Beduini massiliensis]